MGNKYRWRDMPKWMFLVLTVTDAIGELGRKILALVSPFWRQGYPFPEPKRILAIRCDYIGDLLMTTPALRALRQRFPKAHITVLAQPSSSMILRLNPD
ncbi:MAG: hypothetical protein NZ805_11115, partial [Armatimonadetes bacterium]|nr:hypothetical protein [Armatimonadota bacterium]